MLSTSGPYDPKVAARLRENVFAIGNTRDPAEAYRSFRGRDPGIDALMRILKNDKGCADAGIFNIGNPKNDRSIKELGCKKVTLFTEPTAKQSVAVGQDTAVTSVVPAGTACSTQVDPAFPVVRTAPGPAPVVPTCPTAVQFRTVGQATAVR